MADLKLAGTFETMSPADIKNHITRFKITPKRDLFKQRAVEVFCAAGHNLIDLLRARIQRPLKTDPELLTGIDSLLEGAGVAEAARTALWDEMIRKFMDRLREHLSDAKMPDDKRAVMEKVFTQLMQDATIRTLLSDR